jgi:hypothetical protein
MHGEAMALTWAFAWARRASNLRPPPCKCLNPWFSVSREIRLGCHDLYSGRRGTPSDTTDQRVSGMDSGTGPPLLQSALTALRILGGLSRAHLERLGPALRRAPLVLVLRRELQIYTYGRDTVTTSTRRIQQWDAFEPLTRCLRKVWLTRC